MIILKKIGYHLLVLAEDNMVTFNIEDSTRRELRIAGPLVQSNLTKSVEALEKLENRITSACVSKDAQFLAITRQNRQLIVYDSNFNIINNILTKRAVSKARFTNGNDILAADKTGDVYLYKFQTAAASELLLGHLSMLLDVTVSECGKYIVTCDRDEKIRVSRFPNAYSIVSYCLGHREFVTNLEFSEDILISASGDGTIRFWDFLNGVELFVVNTNDYVKDKSTVDKFCKEMDGEKVDISALPIVDMQVFQDIVGVTLLGYNGIQLYRMDRSNGQLNVRVQQTLTVPSEPISFTLSGELFILTNVELSMYNLNAECYIKVNSDATSKLFTSCKGLLSENNVDASVMSALYKRKFDNVQDYLEKKKLRMESKS